MRLALVLLFAPIFYSTMMMVYSKPIHTALNLAEAEGEVLVLERLGGEAEGERPEAEGEAEGERSEAKGEAEGERSEEEGEAEGERPEAEGEAEKPVAKAGKPVAKAPTKAKSKANTDAPAKANNAEAEAVPEPVLNVANAGVVGSVLSVIGFIYALSFGFTLQISSERFFRIQEAVYEEGSSINNLLR